MKCFSAGARPGTSIFWMAACAIAQFFLVGCGYTTNTVPKLSTSGTSSPKATLTCDTTLAAVQQGTSFDVSPESSNLTMYPGQTTTLTVDLPTATGSGGEVTVSYQGHVQGLTVAPVKSKIGSSATLTFKSDTTLATGCFTGESEYYTYTLPIAIQGISNGELASTNINLNVVLWNESFQPTKTDIPVMNITTDGGVGITSKDNYVTGTVTVADSSDSSNNMTATMKVKGHGNSTWYMPKKAYKIKLDSKATMLGMPKAKSWVLLANFDDKTLLRNVLANRISTLTDLAWTPHSQFVELYVDGSYSGTYSVSEQVEIDKNRVNITEMDEDDNSGNSLTGGYLLEFDQGSSDTYSTSTPRNLPYGVEDPDPPTTEQATYISNYIADSENRLWSDSFEDETLGWRSRMDEASFVKWFLVEELMENNDGIFWSSDYFYKDRKDPLLYMGPVWDFDIAAGNVNYGLAQDPSLSYIRAYTEWYKRLFSDPTFEAAVKAQWTAMRAQIGTLPDYIDTQAAALATAQSNNFQRWPILGIKVWPNPQAAGTYQAEVDYLKSWLTQRIAYMDATYLN